LKNLLIVFYRNPELGKVKTRLAKTVGDEKALAIYLRLAEHTRSISQDLSLDKVVYYSHFVDTEDTWPNSSFQKKAQQGNDLGEKMQNAFAEGFKNEYTSICIIGTDCFELTSEIIQQAFDQLEKHDTVIGPANDGGYYLLGMKKSTPELFQNKNWSTDSVAKDTIHDFKRLRLSFVKLPPLTDVDEEKDLPPILIY
jgi:uncharacterized protein